MTQRTLEECQEIGHIWHRYEMRFSYSRPVHLTFRAIRATRCGVWIQDTFSISTTKPRLIIPLERDWRGRPCLGAPRRTYAWFTAAEAWESLRIRKRRQVAHLERDLSRARDLLEEIDMPFSEAIKSRLVSPPPSWPEA